MKKETLVRTIYMKIPPRLLCRINLVHIFVTSGFAAEPNHLTLDSERTGSAWQCQSLVQTLAQKIQSYMIQFLPPGTLCHCTAFSLPFLYRPLQVQPLCRSLSTSSLFSLQRRFRLFLLSQCVFLRHCMNSSSRPV